jgi:predicted sugar kinase
MAFDTPQEFYDAITAHITRELDGVRAAVLAVILPNVLTTNAQTGADAVKIDETFKKLGTVLANQEEGEARDEKVAEVIADLQKQVAALNAAKPA